jgi:hypothetical protein
MEIDHGEYAEHVAHYRERGYTVFPRFYGERQMAAWRDKLDEMHAEYGEWWLSNTLEYAPRLFWPAVSHSDLLDFAELVMGPFVQLVNLTLAGFRSVPVDEARGKVSGWHRDRWGKVPRGSVYQRPNAINAIAYLQDLSDEYGPLRVIESGDRPEDVAEIGEILVTPDPLRTEWMQRAVEARVSAVIAPSADDATLSELALAPTIVGLPLPPSAPLTPPVPTLLTEGFGHTRMPRALQRMFRASADEVVSVVGSRQPGESEVLLPPGPSEAQAEELRADGLPVRIVAGPDAGEEGVVVGPARDEARAPSGSPAICVRVQRTQGGTVTVPAANCEAIA